MLSERLKENREALFAYPLGMSIFAGVLILLFGIWLGANVFSSDSGYSVNLYTEFMGVLATIAIIDVINRGRAKREKIEELKERLVREAGSNVNSVAVQAVYELRKNGWLTGEDGLLRNKSLRGANFADGNLDGANLSNSDLYDAKLERAKLQDANLVNANLFQTKLSDANLIQANLQNSHLEGVNLVNANLWGANLKYAILTLADIQGARLWKVDFRGASLEHANLSNVSLFDANLADTTLWQANIIHANLEQAKFNENTILPDAEVLRKNETGNFIYDKYWTPETDMTRYTDPNHPEFWQPDWVKDKNSE